MKVLYHHRTLADGAEGVHIHEMINSFEELSNHVILVGVRPRMIDDNVKVEITTRDKLVEWLRWKMPKTFYELAAVLVGLLNYFKVKKAIEEHNPDFIYKRHSNYDWGPLYAAKHKKVPLFLEANTCYSMKEIIQLDSIVLPRLTRFFEKRIFRHANHIFAVSTPLKRKIESIGVPGDKVTVLPNGVNLKKFRPRDKRHELLQKFNLENSFVVGFVGVPREWHGLNFLLDAFDVLHRVIPEVKLLFVGANCIDERFKRDEFAFTGRIKHAEIADYIALFDIAVLPAEHRLLASPMKILEYMAMGKASVAPELENIRDLISDGHDGVLFTPNDMDDFTGKIIDLYKSPELREAIGREAIRTVSTRLNWNNNAEKVLSLASHFLQARNGASH